MLSIFRFVTHSLRFTKGFFFFFFRFLLFMFYNPVYDNLKQHTDIASHSKFTIYCCHLLASGGSVTVARRHFENTRKQETSCKNRHHPLMQHCLHHISMSLKRLLVSCFQPWHILPRKNFEKNSHKEAEEGGFKPISNLHNGCKAPVRFYFYQGKLGDSKWGSQILLSGTSNEPRKPFPRGLISTCWLEFK